MQEAQQARTGHRCPLLPGWPEAVHLQIKVDLIKGVYNGYVQIHIANTKIRVSRQMYRRLALVRRRRSMFWHLAA